MKVEEFYKESGGVEYDKHDKRANHFTYFDMMGFASAYHSKQLNPLPIKGWIEFTGNELLFNEMAKKNCPCRYEDGTQKMYNDVQPMAMLTHFKLI